MNRWFFVFLLAGFASSGAAQDAPENFDQAKALAVQSMTDAGYQKHNTEVLQPYFNETYLPVLDKCFESFDEPDDAKFELVLNLQASGQMDKVYRNLETNIGLCLITELEKAKFPSPPTAPYYYHILMDKLAGNFTCPPDTILNEESRPELSVSWCEVIINGDTVFHGPYRAWWPNGRLGNEAHYEYGVPVGLWRGWYASGALQGSNLYENGVVVHKERYPEE
ncbi:MAG: hypothetical protein KTR32_22835 [Granulosicoccus sp.]|nr:hypothetical protein [Granulosicoccus sp.]